MSERRISEKEWCAALDRLAGGPKRPLTNMTKPRRRRKLSLAEKRRFHDQVRHDTPMFVVDDCLDRRGPAYIGKLLAALASYDEFNDADPKDDHSTGIFTLGRTRVAFKISVLEVFRYVPADRSAGYDDLPSVDFSRVS